MSAALFRRQDFGPKCPLGGSWYACGYGTYFVGCCAQNPCDVPCAQGSIYAGAFDPAYYGKFPDATCGSSSQFYTCPAGRTFWGCCKSNPCTSSPICPVGSLQPAYLDSDAQRTAYHASGGTTMTSSTRTSTRTASSTSITSSTSSTSAGVATTSTAVEMISSEPAHKQPVAAIAGGAAGGAFALAVVIGLLIYYICHAKKSRDKHTDTVVRRLSNLPAMMTGHEKTNPASQPDAPPGYSSPNPNYYSLDPSLHDTYAPHQQYQQQHVKPQEMSIEPLSPVPFTVNPATSYNRRGVSELSEDTARLSELGTHLPPSKRQANFTQPSPLSVQTGFGQQTPTSVRSSDQTQNWVAQGLGVHGGGERPGGDVVFQTQYSPGTNHGRGIGVQGFHEGLGRESMGRQGVYPTQYGPGGYHGT